MKNTSTKVRSKGSLASLVGSLAIACAVLIAPIAATADSGVESLIWGVLKDATKQITTPVDQQQSSGAGNAGIGASAAPGAASCSKPSNYETGLLWPETGCDTRNFTNMKFDAAKAQKKAFVDASKVRCSGPCEGGYSYDAWAHFFLVKGGNYSEKFQQMLLAMSVGQKLTWKGAHYNGVIEATGQSPIGPYPCRQYHWTLKEGNKVMAEREGLLCEYKAEYANVAVWHEVI